MCVVDVVAVEVVAVALWLTPGQCACVGVVGVVVLVVAVVVVVGVVVVVVVVVDRGDVSDSKAEVARRHVHLAAAACAQVHHDCVLAQDVVVGQGAVVHQRAFTHDEELLLD